MVNTQNSEYLKGQKKLHLKLCRIKEETFKALTGLSSQRKAEELKIRGALHLEGLHSRGILILHACNKI